MPTQTVSTPLLEFSYPWACRAWACTATEEAAFVAGIRRRLDPPPTGPLAGQDSRPPEFARRDVTAVVTALRSGLTATMLLDAAPGLDPARLLAAHTSMETRRHHAASAWEAIAMIATTDALEQYGEQAAQLVPALVGRLRHEARRSRRIDPVVREAAWHVDRTTECVLELEQQLDLGTLSPAECREVGEMLFDAHSTGAWSLETFVPSRVGALMPDHVASLLSTGHDVARFTAA